MIAGAFFLVSSLVSALSYVEVKTDKLMSQRDLRYLAFAMVVSVIGPTALIASFS